MITIREYQPEDIPALVNYIGDFLQESPRYKSWNYSPDKMKFMLEHNVNNALFFCQLAVDDGVIVGGLCAQAVKLIWTDDVIVMDHLIYTRPQARGTRAVALLMTAYKKWARARRPQAIYIGATTGIDAEAFGKMAAHFNFQECGRVYELRSDK